MAGCTHNVDTLVPGNTDFGALGTEIYADNAHRGKRTLRSKRWYRRGVGGTKEGVVGGRIFQVGVEERICRARLSGGDKR